METEEILNQIRKKMQSTVTIRWYKNPLGSQQVPNKWGTCIHYNIEKLKNDVATKEILSWEIDGLQQGDDIIREILINDGASHREVNEKMSEMIDILKLKEKNKLFVCFFHDKSQY